MNLDKAIKQRRSIRKFSNTPIEFEKITKILESNIYAPSAGNMKDHRIILVNKKSIIQEIADTASLQYWIATAPAVLVVCSDPKQAKSFYGDRGENLYTIQNSSAAIQNMLLTATSLGLSSCWIGSFDDSRMKVVLNIPQNINIHALIPIGYSAQEAEQRELENLDTIIYFNEYGSKIENMDRTLREYSKEIEEITDDLKPKAESILEQLKQKFEELINKFNKK
ncbi:MAG: nitroreductase family protein [Candidatus Woesearchaeota archaeon]